jgi:hypothetical protein
MKIPHWKIYAVIAFVITMVAVLAPETGTWMAVGHSGATFPAASLASPDRPEASDGATRQRFDYFPDHYRNQAQKPAEPIDAF